MDNTSRSRPSRNDRARLSARGLARFAVIGRAGDRALIRSLARRLAQGEADALRLRGILDASAPGPTAEDPPLREGGVYAALRRSPLVGAELELARPRGTGRDLDL